MKKWLRKAKLSQQLTVLNCLCILIPTLLLWYTMLISLQNTAIQTKKQEAALRRNQVVTEVERMAELCTISTQVFLNTPDLVNHLSCLERGEKPDALALLEFYREDIASLEKIILSNPDLYQIRVYSTADDIDEMMPILYSAERMERMPWAGMELETGCWFLDYEDHLFADNPAVPHVMSLVTPVRTSELGLVGVLEVSVRMDKVMPELFEQEGGNFSVLLSADAGVLAGSSPLAAEQLSEFMTAEDGIEIHRLGGKSVLVTQTWLKEFDCGYLQITSLASIDAAVRRQAILLFAVLFLVFALIVFAVSRLNRRILRAFYGAFDGLRAFADGDIDASVEVTGEGELADFARETGGLLDKIRQLMRDNVERELQAKNSEVRALYNQINAHFIYNVLEAIKMMAEIDERYDIADAVTSLGKLLRYSMKWESGNVRLEREIDYIGNYITLMNLRFDYVIELKTELAPELWGQRLPKVSLQPIVENAVVHGAAAKAADTVISLRGVLKPESGCYQILIKDEGIGMDEAQLARLRRQIAGEEPTQSTSGNGIGLNNVQNRIRQTFGEEYGLEVVSSQGVGTTVIVTLPYQEEEKENG